jgi:hypothetical protein
MSIITVNALVNLGVRVIVVPLYRVKARRTTAQALCLATLILSLAILTMLLQLPSFAPHYVTYGARQWVNTEVWSYTVRESKSERASE